MKKKIYIILTIMIVMFTSFGSISQAGDYGVNKSLLQILEAYYKENGKLEGCNGWTLNGVINQINVELAENSNLSKDEKNALKSFSQKAAEENQKKDNNVSDEEYKKYTAKDIRDYMDKKWPKETEFPLSNDVKDKWLETLQADDGSFDAKRKESYIKRLNNNNIYYEDEKIDEKPDKKPVIPPSNPIEGGNIESIVNPDDYIPDPLTQADAGEFMGIIGIILGALRIFGTATCVITLVVLGVRFMLGSASEKATYKETMVPYLIGAVMVFIIPTIIQIIYDLVQEIQF